MGSRREFEAPELVPATWLRIQPADRFAVYNPAIVRHRGRLLMAYRVDFGYEKPFRVACAICELDERLDVVPGSVVTLSDTIAGGTDNHYDSRFLVFRDRLYVHYNNDWNTVPNQVSLVELDADTLEARSPARVIDLEGPRQPCEKNWMLFAHHSGLYAIYQLSPHVVLRLELNDSGPVRCWPVFRTEWDTSAYTRRYGDLRGGAPPVRVGELYVSLFHSRSVRTYTQPLGTTSTASTLKQARLWASARRWFREWFAPVRYYGGTYTFTGEPPFAPIGLAAHPLLRPEQEGRRRKPTASHMSPRRVVYPCGLVRLHDDRWLVSYGVHDERAALRVFTSQEIEGQGTTTRG